MGQRDIGLWLQQARGHACCKQKENPVSCISDNSKQLMGSSRSDMFNEEPTRECDTCGKLHSAQKQNKALT